MICSENWCVTNIIAAHIIVLSHFDGGVGAANEYYSLIMCVSIAYSACIVLGA